MPWNAESQCGGTRQKRIRSVPLHAAHSSGAAPQSLRATTWLLIDPFCLRSLNSFLPRPPVIYDGRRPDCGAIITAGRRGKRVFSQVAKRRLCEMRPFVAYTRGGDRVRSYRRSSLPSMFQKDELSVVSTNGMYPPFCPLYQS